MGAAGVLVARYLPQVLQQHLVQVAEAAADVDAGVGPGEVLHAVAGVDHRLEHGLQQESDLRVQTAGLGGADPEEGGVEAVDVRDLRLLAGKTEVVFRVPRAISDLRIVSDWRQGGVEWPTRSTPLQSFSQKSGSDSLAGKRPPMPVRRQTMVGGLLQGIGGEVLCVEQSWELGCEDRSEDGNEVI